MAGNSRILSLAKVSVRVPPTAGEGGWATSMSRQPAVAVRRGASYGRERSRALVTLVSRLLVAQAGASLAVSLSYGKRHLAPILLAVGVAVALCGLAAVMRSGTHSAWLLGVCVESGIVAVGLFWFAYTGYIGGTLLAIISLGTMLHPSVARAFTVPDRSGAVLADSAGELEALS
jgi:hypothetical protein